MPMHDWTQVEDGIYHHFHNEWISSIHRSLLKRLPKGYYSLEVQRTGPFGPDVLTLKRKNYDSEQASGGGVSTLSRPKTKYYQESDQDFYTRKRKSVVIRHILGDDIVAVIEVVSPGNKDSHRALRAFVDKSSQLISQSINLTVIDPFPPGSRDPNGLHAEVIKEFDRHPLAIPQETPLCAFAYECDDIGVIRSYIEPFAVGDLLPNIPVFLYPEMYVQIPLESTYMSAWEAVPEHLQKLIEGTVK